MCHEKETNELGYPLENGEGTTEEQLYQRTKAMYNHIDEEMKRQAPGPLLLTITLAEDIAIILAALRTCADMYEEILNALGIKEAK